VGFAVVETTDDGVILERKGELLPELVAGRKDRVRRKREGRVISRYICT